MEVLEGATNLISVITDYNRDVTYAGGKERVEHVIDDGASCDLE
jgi:hypothetical protein